MYPQALKTKISCVLTPLDSCLDLALSIGQTY